MIEVKQHVRHALHIRFQRSELAALRQDKDRKYEMAGKSAQLESIKEQLIKVAPSQGRVLITGESGTGKELVAYAIHRYSPRKDGPFVKINCAAIPQNLIESELFGHEKGSFTGALAQKKGKFEIANQGTLLLDEIGDMDGNTQTKVLRVLQDGEFERVGGLKTIKVDVRVIAATHRDLEAMIDQGSFRQDLYYRLNVVPIRVPPLRERTEDIPLLAVHFLKSYCEENGAPPRILSRSALEILSQQRYPGNIRELRNVVERIAIMAEENEISGEYVKTFFSGKEETGNSLFTRPRPLVQAKEELEKTFVQTQLQQNLWDIPKTAQILGLQRTNLHRKIRQLGIKPASAK
jgi:two-component system nitrogen regulation response regulator NtrX